MRPRSKALGVRQRQRLAKPSATLEARGTIGRSPRAALSTARAHGWLHEHQAEPQALEDLRQKLRRARAGRGGEEAVGWCFFND